MDPWRGERGRTGQTVAQLFPFYLVGAVRLDWFKPLITTKSGL